MFKVPEMTRKTTRAVWTTWSALAFLLLRVVMSASDVEMVVPTSSDSLSPFHMDNSSTVQAGLVSGLTN